MSKKNNVNPNFYKVGGRGHTDGADKGDSGTPSPGAKDEQRQDRQELPGQDKTKQPKR